MSLHSIRLAGPWEEIASEHTPPAKIQLPYTLPQNAAPVVLRRRFHSPSGLNSNARVRVSIDAPHILSEITINDQPVARMDNSHVSDSARSVFEVTSHLASFNTLKVQLNHNVRELVAVTLEIVESTSSYDGENLGR